MLLKRGTARMAANKLNEEKRNSMSFPAQVFRILIASPSDVTQEREIAVRAIQEWNDLNSGERQIILLPLRWETHSAPEYGKRPQEVINRQVVDHCDLVVGIFWTRVGSPTGIADSGTIEEIERVAKGGKPVMLYFSNAKQDPEKIDLDQLSKLREFKKITFPKALIEHYADYIEFKDKLSKQVEIQLRTMLAEQAEETFDGAAIRPITDIVLHFADPTSGVNLGAELTLKTRFLDVTDFKAIPDYILQQEEEAPLSLPHNAVAPWLNNLRDSETNKDYYKQRVTSIVLKEFFHPIRFWLKNRGGVGARDVYIDLEIKGLDGKGILLKSKDDLPNSQPSTTRANGLLYASSHPNSPEELITLGINGWTSHLEVPALQPQRELSPKAELVIGARESCEVVILAKIYADTLPEPAVQEIKLKIEVEKITVQANDIVNEILIPAKKGKAFGMKNR